MPTRLSELLERIRPAGAPGAPSEGELQQHLDRRAGEIAAITDLLDGFEAEAGAVADEARARAERLEAQSERRVREIVSGLPDRVAVAEARAARHLEEADRAEIQGIGSAADATIAHLRARGEDRIPQLVDEAIATIWSQVVSDARARPST